MMEVKEGDLGKIWQCECYMFRKRRISSQCLQNLTLSERNRTQSINVSVLSAGETDHELLLNTAEREQNQELNNGKYFPFFFFFSFLDKRALQIDAAQLLAGIQHPRRMENLVL